jgi:hypothetical protein
MNKWEYLLVVNTYGSMAGEVYYILPGAKKVKHTGKDTNLESTAALLNFFGDQGWEVIGSTDDAYGGAVTRNAIWTLRRMKA